MKKSLVICTVVLCVVLFCSTAMASGHDFMFELKSGGAFGSGRVTTDQSSRYKKADNEGRAYVTLTHRSIVDVDELKIFVAKDGSTTPKTETLYVNASTPSLNKAKTLDYISSYDQDTYYRLRCEAITLWHDASVEGRWNP